MLFANTVWHNNMIKHCSKNTCYARVVYACNCKDPQTFFCNSHFSEHTKTPGRHLTECLLITFTEDQKIHLQPKIIQINHSSQEFQHNLLRSSAALIKSIKLETSKAVNKIKELQKMLVDLLSDKGIDQDDYEFITHFKGKIQMPVIEKADDIKNSVNEFLKAQDNENSGWEECDQVIFSRDTNIGEMVSIDLTTFKLSNLNFPQKIGRGSQACKLDETTYFFHGGYLLNLAQGETYLLNIREKQFTALQSGPEKASAASVLKDNKVYIFGGHNLFALDTCDTYDLILKEWKSINPLPKPCTQITAGLIDRDIILSGLNFNCCYAYHDSVYINILNLPEDKEKVVLEGWILCDSILYQNKDRHTLQWTRHNVNNPWSRPLSVYTTFKKGKLIYFIDADCSLMRIDTELKKLDKCEFYE